MRLTILGSAVLMFLAGAISFEVSSLDARYLNTALLGFILGGLNLFLSLFTRPGGGVQVPQSSQDPVKLIVDKAVMGSTIYIMGFADNKMVLKRLSSGRVTVIAAAILAVMGLFLGGLIGALIGGLTAFSLQEFTTQKKREQLRKGDLLDASNAGDLEIPFTEVEKLELTRNRVRLYLKDRLIRIVISRRYPDKMRPILQKIIGSFVPAGVS